MDLLEHQGKQLFEQFGIPVARGRLATTPAEARAAAEALGGTVAVKAQVLTGGRGKAGGIAVATSPDEVEAAAERILGLDIRGHVVRTVWVERAAPIAREHYLSVTLDRGAKQPLLMFTTEGGVEIEEVAARDPDALVRVHVEPLEGLREHHVRELLARVEDDETRAQIAAIVERLYRCFVESDALLCEINPLVVTDDGSVLALDAKVTIDDAALARHPELAAQRDATDGDPLEAYARKQGVTYVKLDGSVGILSNGAGLAMSAVDLVVFAGGTPANFCDIGGGGGSVEWVVTCLDVVTRDPAVRSVFFNVFGGMVRCDQVAHGLLAALDQLGLTVPVVVRLDGTNAVAGRAILAEAARDGLVVAPTMLEAATRAVELSRSATTKEQR